MIEYDSLDHLVKLADAEGISLSELVLYDQARVLEKDASLLIEEMRLSLQVMHRSTIEGAGPTVRSFSGLSGGGGFLLQGYVQSSLAGAFVAGAVAKAVAVAEYNAAMGKIVAAPTAGSCGILPAAILTMLDEKGCSEDSAVMALFCAGAIGMVIAGQASISGAEGGCQAECGSAAAMAAGAIVEMAGGTPLQVGEAAAMALKMQMGLVCDPVAGLVEVPCIKRNAGGISVAITAADMALAGMKSVIPVDEVIAAMGEVGRALPDALRETARGGLAATPTGEALKTKIFGGE
jgi:L-serine dehydratase